ncbi:g5812 [Coccomyxa elongata]
MHQFSTVPRRHELPLRPQLCVATCMVRSEGPQGDGGGAPGTSQRRKPGRLRKTPLTGPVGQAASAALGQCVTAGQRDRKRKATNAEAATVLTDADTPVEGVVPLSAHWVVKVSRPSIHAAEARESPP